ncbi:MAG: DMT family transporter [Chloroflexi bacterium]|nr:DMT family transporter [Chloroflexota bacterium]
MKSRIILLITAIIWGLSFVAQRQGMEFVSPFTFNAVRFLIGCITLLPLALFYRDTERATANRKTIFLGSGAVGLFLFLAVSLQQFGVVYTTAGKAGFITGLYVIIVPILGLALRQRTGAWTWIGAFAGVIGLYLLSVTDALTIEYGDLLVLIGAFFWATHVHLIAKFSSPIGAIRLSLLQFAICAAASFVAAMLFETIRVEGLLDGAAPILYAGVLSVGVAYTLQVIGQRETPPSQAALILCLETVVAALGGWWLLNETLPLRGVIGCAVMFAGMIVSQLDARK